MNELIQIIERDGQQLVDARELHSFLESKRQFGNWIQYRIKAYGFVEGVDFSSFNNFVKREKGATTRKEYALTISCAKELAMVEGNKKGKAARLYFIECERRLKESSLEQRVSMLEAEVAELKRQRQQTAPPRPYTRKALPTSELDLVKRHFGPPKDDGTDKFLSASEILALLPSSERGSYGYKRIAQAVIKLTGRRSSFITLGDHKVKRGYYVQLLTPLS